MFRKNIVNVESNKHYMRKVLIEIISIISCMLFMIYLNIKTDTKYKSGGITILSSQNELCFVIVMIFFSFVLVSLCVIVLRGIFLKKWIRDKKLELLIISACIFVFTIYMIIFSISPNIAFSKDEIIYRDFSSNIYKWSDIVKIQTYATKELGGSKAPPYLYGVYNLYFSDGTKINLWNRNDDFIEYYKEINNIVKEHKISVYNQPIDEDVIHFIKEHYNKKMEDIIFQVVTCS